MTRELETTKNNTKTIQESLIGYMKQQEDRTIYHMVITYKKYDDRIYTENEVNTFFKEFYLRDFLPYVMNSKHYNHDAQRNLQPICLAFLDEHRTDSLKKHSDETTMKFSRDNNRWNRLHHHAVLAVHNSHINRINSLIDPIELEGINTIPKESSPKILTTFIAERTPDVLGYASKRLYKYPDFLAFPDRWSHK